MFIRHLTDVLCYVMHLCLTEGITLASLYFDSPLQIFYKLKVTSQLLVNYQSEEY